MTLFVLALQQTAPLTTGSDQPDMKTVLIILGAVAWFIREMYPLFNQKRELSEPAAPIYAVVAVLKEQILPIQVQQVEILRALQQGQQQQHDHEIVELGILENLTKGIEAVRSTSHTVANVENVILGTVQQIARMQERA